MLFKESTLTSGIIRSLIVSDDDIDELFQLMSELPSSCCDIAFDFKNIKFL